MFCDWVKFPFLSIRNCNYKFSRWESQLATRFETRYRPLCKTTGLSRDRAIQICNPGPPTWVPLCHARRKWARSTWSIADYTTSYRDDSRQRECRRCYLQTWFRCYPKGHGPIDSPCRIRPWKPTSKSSWQVSLRQFHSVLHNGLSFEHTNERAQPEMQSKSVLKWRISSTNPEMQKQKTQCRSNCGTQCTRWLLSGPRMQDSKRSCLEADFFGSSQGKHPSVSCEVQCLGKLPTIFFASPDRSWSGQQVAWIRLKETQWNRRRIGNSHAYQRHHWIRHHRDDSEFCPTNFQTFVGTRGLQENFCLRNATRLDRPSIPSLHFCAFLAKQSWQKRHPDVVWAFVITIQNIY